MLQESAHSRGELSSFWPPAVLSSVFIHYVRSCWFFHLSTWNSLSLPPCQPPPTPPKQLLCQCFSSSSSSLYLDIIFYCRQTSVTNFMIMAQGNLEVPKGPCLVIQACGLEMWRCGISVSEWRDMEFGNTRLSFLYYRGWWSREVDEKLALEELAPTACFRSGREIFSRRESMHTWKTSKHA